MVIITDYVPAGDETYEAIDKASRGKARRQGLVELSRPLPRELIEMTGERESARQRRSRQREVILEELRKLKTHPRSDELYQIVRQRIPNVSLGTVYRNLDRLQREGLALEIYCGDFVRYDGNTRSHDHFMCRICRRVWDFGDTHVEREAAPQQTAEGFQVDGQYTVFSGLCPDCLARQRDTVPTTA